jgi:hypothetical protein
MHLKHLLKFTSTPPQLNPNPIFRLSGPDRAILFPLFQMLKWLFLTILMLGFLCVLALCFLNLLLTFQGLSLYIVAGGLVLFVVLVILTLSSRAAISRTLLFDIPKKYLPMNADAQSSLLYRSAVSLRAKPSIPRGWDQRDFNYLDTCLDTLLQLETMMIRMSGHLKRSEGMDCRRYLLFLVDNHVLDAQIATVYIDEYEKLEVSLDDVDNEYFKAFMKLFTALVKSAPL